MLERHLLNSSPHLRYAFIRSGDHASWSLGFANTKFEELMQLDEGFDYSQTTWCAFLLEEDRDKYCAYIDNLEPGGTGSIYYRLKHPKTQEVHWLRDQVYIKILEDGKHLVCGLAELLFEERDQKYQNYLEQEVAISNKIAKAALAGAGYRAIGQVFIQGITQLVEYKACRLAVFDKKTGHLVKEQEDMRSVPISFLEKKLSFNYSDVIPILEPGSLFKRAFDQDEAFITTNKDEINAIFKEHVRSKALKSAAGWARKFLNIKTAGIIPLVVNGEPYGVIAFTSNKVLKSTQIATIERLKDYACFALVQTAWQQKLEADRDFYHNVLSSAPIEIVILDEQMRYVFVNELAIPNPEFRELALGKTDRELLEAIEYNADYIDRREEYFNKLKESRSPVKWQDEVVRNNQKRLILRSIIPYFKDGALQQIFGFGIDITELHQSETEKSALIHDLSRRIADQTEYNYVVSHHLRAPVASLLGLTQILDLASSREEEQQIIKLIQDSSTEMDTVLHDLNMVLNLKSEVSAEPDRFYLSSVFEGLKTHFEEDLEEIGALWRFDMNPALSEKRFYTYKPYLENVLRTLITNAIVYRSHKRTLDLLVYAEDKGHTVEIVVRDNGLGIDMSKHGKNIFGLYKRFHPTHPGRGLGLHIAKNQIDKLNGSIEVDSIEDVGTSFKLSLPYLLVSEFRE